MSRSTALAATAAAATLVLSLLSACGDDSVPEASTGAGPAGLGGTSIEKATCEEWNGATVDERLATVNRLEEAAAPKPGQEQGLILDSDRAYKTLDYACSSEVGRGFLLYEVYNRAATFAPLGDGE